MSGLLIAIIAGGIALAAVGSGALLKGIDIGEARKDAELQPKIVAAEKKAAEAQSANAGFAVNEAGYKEQIRACNQSVAALKADDEITRAVQAKKDKETDARNAKFSAVLAQLASASNRSTPPDQQCDAVKKVILDVGTQMQILDALGLAGKDQLAPTVKPALSITAPPKSAIKTLGVGK